MLHKCVHIAHVTSTYQAYIISLLYAYICIYTPACLYHTYTPCVYDSICMLRVSKHFPCGERSESVLAGASNDPLVLQLHEGEPFETPPMRSTLVDRLWNKWQEELPEQEEETMLKEERGNSQCISEFCLYSYMYITCTERA